MRLMTAQAPHTILVANLEAGSDPSRNSAGNPVKVRTGFVRQNLPDVSRDGGDIWERSPSNQTPGTHTAQGLLTYTVADTPVRASCTITVVDNTFTLPATIVIGGFRLTSGVDYTVGGGVNATATNVAAAIDGLPTFSAVAVGATVTVADSYGPNGNNIPVQVLYTGSVQNFSVSSNYMAGGEPFVGPPTLL